VIADQDHPMPGYRQAISGNLRPSSSVLFWQSRNCGPILPRSGRSTPLPCRALRPFSGHLGLSSNSALNPITSPERLIPIPTFEAAPAIVPGSVQTRSHTSPNEPRAGARVKRACGQGKPGHLSIGIEESASTPRREVRAAHDPA
jgi:hypothetical protein